MPIHDSSYKHWVGVHQGVWVRRWVIAQNGLRGAFQSKWMRHLAVLCWGMALLQIAALFFLGQLLVKDSMVVQWAGNLNSGLQGFVNSMVGWLESHPEISVPTTQNVLFFYFCRNLTSFSFFALALAIPHLITRDLGSNAIIIYSAKALNRTDYLIGKFIAVFALLTVTWLGPVLVAWLFGNLLSPKWSFFWHSRSVLAHFFGYLLLSMTVLGIVALGVSSLATKERTTVSIWTIWWMIGFPLVGISAMTKPWLKYFSLNFNLNQLARGIFRVDRDYAVAQENIPIAREILRALRSRSELLSEPRVGGSIVALILVVVIAVVIIRKKVRPE